MSVNAVSVGELLFDVFPYGERLGGAPANFAIHAVALGARSHLVSAVGSDGRGLEALQMLDQAGVGVTGIPRVDSKQTGVVLVELIEGQPTYEIVEDVAWDDIDIVPEVVSEIAAADLLCWGTLGQRSCRSRKTHRQLFDLLSKDCLKVCDINFRMRYHSVEVVEDCLRRADLLKLNDKEIPILRAYVDGYSDDRDYLREIRHRFRIDTIVLTLGAEGCRVSSQDIDFKVPGNKVDVVNTVGSGDAFTAAFALKLLSGADLRSCAEHANQVGAFVATQDSGTPSLPVGYRILS